MNKTRKYLALFLTSVFIFCTVPNEILHEFIGHEDTIYHYNDSEQRFEKLHTHCDLSLLVLPSSLTVFSFSFLPETKIAQFIPILRSSLCHITDQRTHLGRAPPFLS